MKAETGLERLGDILARMYEPAPPERGGAVAEQMEPYEETTRTMLWTAAKPGEEQRPVGWSEPVTTRYDPRLPEGWEWIEDHTWAERQWIDGEYYVTTVLSDRPDNQAMGGLRYQGRAYVQWGELTLEHRGLHTNSRDEAFQAAEEQAQRLLALAKRLEVAA